MNNKHEEMQDTIKKIVVLILIIHLSTHLLCLFLCFFILDHNTININEKESNNCTTEIDLVHCVNYMKLIMH